MKTDYEMRCWARERVLHWTKFYEQKLNIQLLPPKVEFSNRLRTTAGHANSSINRIVLSNHYLMHEGEKFDSTIAHEVSHIVADVYYKSRCQHDNRWCYIFSITGYPVKRCHEYTETTAKVCGHGKFYCYQCDKSVLISKLLFKRTLQRAGKIQCLVCKSSYSTDYVKNNTKFEHAN